MKEERRVGKLLETTGMANVISELEQTRSETYT